MQNTTQTFSRQCYSGKLQIYMRKTCGLNKVVTGGRGFALATMSMTPGYFNIGNKKKMEPKELPFNSLPTNCMYPTTQNISDSPAHDNPERNTCI